MDKVNGIDMEFVFKKTGPNTRNTQATPGTKQNLEAIEDYWERTGKRKNPRV